MRFDQLIHQPPGLQQLRQLAAADRLPHANLLLAPPGAGGLPAALSVIDLLLCEDRQGPNGDTGCGKCRACRKTHGYIHPDLHFTFPTVGSKMTSDPFLPQWRAALKENAYLETNDWLALIGAENKQGNITRDACAAMIKKLSLKIFEGNYKVMLIWRPEYLGEEGNRLLKLIEEPPERTVFFLVAERAELILNTILSRCQLTKLTAPTAEDISTGLFTRDRALSKEAIEDAARLADGNFNLALQLVQENTTTYGPLLLEWTRHCYAGSPTKLVKWVSNFAKLGRENQKHFLRYALHFWREFLLLSVSGDDTSGVRLPPNELTAARKLLPLVGLDQLTALTTILSECAEHVERNANPKILFLDASLRIHQILRAPATTAANPATTRRAA